jgi:outer membrane protein assembly factor BamB
MSLVERLAAAALLLALAGCSTIGETVDKINPFSTTTPKIKIAELPTFQPSADLRVSWQASMGSSGEFVFTPAVAGNAVFAAARDGSIARFDEGRQTWRIAVGQPISGGVGADGKLVVVGTVKGEVLAFDAASGKEAWKTRVSSEVLAAPALADGMVFVRSGDARIFGFDAADGKRRWVYQRSTPALTLRSNVGVTPVDRAVLAGFPGGKLVAISTANGAAIWEATVALPKGATELERVADVTSSAVVSGREVCAAAFQGRVACFDLASGSGSWAREVSSRAGLDLDERYVYVSDDKSNVNAYDRGNGASLWKQDKLALRGLSRPLVIGSRIVVGDGQGYVHLLKRDDGAFVARAATDGSAILAEPQRIPGGFLVQTRNGGLYALRVE